MKDYDRALNEIDTIIGKWSRFAPAYNMRAEVYLNKKDTTEALKALDKSVEIDPYDGGTWQALSVISLSRKQWKDAEKYLDKAIHLQPKRADHYINRALARFNQNNLRGTMADYDTALDLDPNNFLGHYNRGLLRAQVGDDNRAILDFDFVLKLEPDNIMALFNRALLLDNTGDLRGAIRDYSRVIKEFPNFWFGLESRAKCYRRLGMTKEAENDEFRVFKAQLYKSLYGKQPRLNKKQLRKRSDIDLDKYNQLVTADENEMKQEYKNDYRGRVQNRQPDMAFMPMYDLSFDNVRSDVESYMPYDKDVDAFNHKTSGKQQLHIVCRPMIIDEPEVLSLLEDIDSASVLVIWHRAAYRMKENDQKRDNIVTRSVIADLDKAISLAPSNPYLYYNRGNAYAAGSDFDKAIDDYNRAVELDPKMAEAYYNRGLAKLKLKKTKEAIVDLGKAGEGGLYKAYSVIKKYSK